MTPPNGEYSIDPLRFIRDQINGLKTDKADKQVIKSEIKRVESQIKNTEDDIDELKAHAMTEKPHPCLHEGDIGEMKTAIESNKTLSQAAHKTASLASDRGFKILMGAVMGFATFGVALCVWAVTVSYTADDAYAKAESVEEALKERAVPAALPTQIIIASPEYLNEKLDAQEPVVTEPGAAVDIEALLERVLVRALEKRDDPLRDM